LKKLLTDISHCEICLPHLKDGVRPVVAVHPESKIAIVGQAPGRIVHNTGVPWDDKSGERLRSWLGVNDNTFYLQIPLKNMKATYPYTFLCHTLRPEIIFG